ncbi:MAG: sugar phosphate isomerase/epimerase [Caldilineaceae bacterium]|nr:sugar phosphate isomerase/epimerase [Caldilineaceae bacterium]
MRRVGIEIFYWIDRWSDDQISYFPRASASGFDGVEISLVSGPDLDWRRMRAELDRLDLAVFCSTGLSPATDITSADATIRAAGTEYLKRCLDTASKVGSPILGGVTYAPWLYFPPEIDLQPYRERSAAAMQEVARVAGDLGLTICVEVLNRFETFMFNTVEEGLRYLDLVGSEHVKLQLDTYHMNMEEDDMGAAIRLAGARIGHFHCAANNRKPPGPGHIDWLGVRRALDDAQYDGWLVIESFPNPAVETGRTVNTWRPLVTDAETEIRRALTFLRENVC